MPNYRNLISGILLQLPAIALAAPITASLQEQTAVAVTIYNNNLALVKDQRRLNIPKGEQTIAFSGVSGQIQPETALLRNTQHSNAIDVLEQNFDFDLLTPQKLLEKSLGQTVQLQRTNTATGQISQVAAEVLSTQGGVVVKINNQIETNPAGQFIFAAVPSGLRAEPTLTTLVNNRIANASIYELSYLTQGLSWQADYVAELTSDKTLDLASWVTLTNNSNTQYSNAQIQLVAGDVNRVQAAVPNARIMLMKSEMSEASVTTEDLMEFKLYNLPRKTTLANAQTKQVALFNAANVICEQQLIFEPATINSYSQYNGTTSSEDTLKPTVKLNIKNDKKSQLGLALPKGTVRVYKRDSQGNAQFVGEDALNHTAENQMVSLTLGKSFDVSAIRAQTDFKIINNNNNHIKTSYTVTLKNAKSEPVTVLYRESFDGEWSITNSNQTYIKRNSQQAQWALTLPAKSDVELSFTADVKML